MAGRAVLAEGVAVDGITRKPERGQQFGFVAFVNDYVRGSPANVHVDHGPGRRAQGGVLLVIIKRRDRLRHLAQPTRRPADVAFVEQLPVGAELAHATRRHTGREKPIHRRLGQITAFGQDFIFD